MIEGHESMNREKSYTSRRQLLAGVAGLGTVSSLKALPSGVTKETPVSNEHFRFCLNTSTIRGFNLSLDREIEIAAQAGFTAIEPWIEKIHGHVQKGGNLADLKKRLDDLGLTVESAIGFANWISENESERNKGLEQARRDMDAVAKIGGKRIAAPPVGAPGNERLDLMRVAERYRKLLELGLEIGVAPQVEIWGASKNLSRLGEAVFVAVESGHPQACILPDVYHIYKGGSDFSGLALLNADCVQVFHFNDYPADPPRDKIGDADRVFPGDGIAPLKDIVRMLQQYGKPVVLSLELFNPAYWKGDPVEVARQGLRKLQAVAKI
jgi:sugar phosphate isomerase/epimerase